MNKRKAGIAAIFVCVLMMLWSSTVMADNQPNGWVNKDGSMYYYTNGKMVLGWKTIGQYQYFFTKTGKMATGCYNIKGKIYWFNEKGQFRKTMYGAGWENTPRGIRYQKGNGSYYKNRWMNIQGKKYRFDKNGYVLTGMKNVLGKTYYFNAKGVMAMNKWIRNNGNLYYFRDNGVMAKSTWIDNRYIGIDGRVIPNYVDETRTNPNKTGWVGFGRAWKYYVNGKPKTGWKVIGGKKYYFQASGEMKIGWYNDGSNYYFFNTSSDRKVIGVMATNFMRIDGKVYYFFPKKVRDSSGQVHPKGSMARSLKIRNNGKEYSFNDKGVCQELE